MKPGPQAEKGGERMNISEAIQARTEQKPFITRKKWRSEFNTWQAADIKIQPTDSPDCCIVMS